MIKIRVVIVEDRPLARDELKYLLKTYHPDIEVVGEFEGPEPAWDKIASGNIDGVFLDINFEQLGEDAGLILAHKFRLLTPTPWIIFVTGHPEYALAGYDFRTVGYILKPIDHLKLDIALNKVREEVKANSQEKKPPARIEIRHKVIRQTTDGHIERIFLNKFLLPEEILYIRSNDGLNTVKVHLLNGSVLDDVNIRLNQWLTDFELPCFAQIRRNILVNLKHVSGFRPGTGRTDAHLLLFKDNPDELPIGANYFAEFKAAKKRLEMAANGALDQKLEAYVAIQKAYAEAISNYQGAWVPQIVTGNGGNSAAGSGAQQMIDLLSIKTAKDLGIDMSIAGADKTVTKKP